jgi:hypothetical protein
LILINLNNLKQEDELHMYDAYRADLQTQEVGGGGGTREGLPLGQKKGKPGGEFNKPGKTPFTNHVINVMDVYTQSNQKYFSLSGIIKLAYSCFPWKLNVRMALSAQFSKYNRYSDTMGFASVPLYLEWKTPNPQCVHF